ncbi:MAG: GIY-YIG nuclease family protein [Patescibacteria group bacterium]|nr:GIY-YIG nuclease family protein [Patescibacteria group bacterium]
MIKDKLKSLPKKPGVYIYRNASGNIIYIGKALVLKNRVNSYFHGKHDAKTTELVANIVDLEWIVVNSEFEALLLEARLIKQHEPKYNIIQKDSKSYLYIVIGKDYPNRVFLARWTELNELNKNLLDWYGPFPSSTDAKRILKIVRRIFPFRSCKTLSKSPCLYHHLHLCPGVCTVETPRRGVSTKNDTYAETIVQICKLLSSKTNALKSLIKSFEKEMKSFAKATDFEKAQAIKNQIDSLRSLTEGWRTVPTEKKDFSETVQELRKILVKYQGYDPITINKIEGYDVSNLGNDIIVGSMVAFVQGEADSSLYRKFNLKFNQVEQDDPQGIKNILRRRLNHPEWVYPQLISVDGGKAQVSAAFSALKEKGLIGQIALLGIAKEEEIIVIPEIQNENISGWKLLRLSRRNPELQLLQAIRDEAHRFAQRYYKEKHKQKLTNF